MHARAVGVENPRHLDPQFVLPPIIEEQSFGAALAFIIARARADRIDVAPVVLGLRMHVGIAIDFRGRGLENFRLHALGETQHVDGAVHAGLGRLHRVVLVVDGRGRTGEIVDLVDLEIDREGHVVADQFEVLVVEQMLDIGARAGEKIVEADDVGALVQQAFAQMRAEKSGTAGDENTPLQMHFPIRSHSIAWKAAGPCMPA